MNVAMKKKMKNKGNVVICCPTAENMTKKI